MSSGSAYDPLATSISTNSTQSSLAKQSSSVPPSSQSRFTSIITFRACSGIVIRCFRRVESCADAVTGAAGPVFVFLCWSLILLGGVVFFDVIARSLTLAPTILLSPIYIIAPLNLYLQYYLVTTVSPGYPSPKAAGDERWTNVLNPRGWLAPERWGWEKRRVLTASSVGGGRGGLGGLGLSVEGRRVRRCRKCDGPKPERTHHCSVCKRCILLMDHHCPWINACVGLHNQRHFVLFMAWLSISCIFVSILGYNHFWDSLNSRSEWYAYSPRLAFTLIYILSLAIGIAVTTLCSWHLFMVSNGETTIESHDNVYLENKARSEGMIYLNPYDLGRRRNLELFFNIGSGGYSATTLLFPLRIPPYSNGWSFPRRSLPYHPSQSGTQVSALHAPELADGLIRAENGSGGVGGMGTGSGSGSLSKYVMGDEEGLTDDEEGGGGFWDGA